MKFYAISDLHLSGEPAAKPMERFGDHWLNHKEKVQKNWLHTVTPEDIVIIGGDISWAMQLSEAAFDLSWIAQLPGHKLLLRGNHDYWWTSLKKMESIWRERFQFIQNNAYLYGTTAICGSRGWILPSNEAFTEEDEKHYKREAARLEISLQAAQKLNPEQIICCLHYPPLFNQEEQTLFTELMEKYQVKYCCYGHIHGEDPQALAVFEGESRGISYKLVSCDTQKFELTPIPVL